MYGNEACAANSMSCAERLDLCGEESGWQERGASGLGPLALGQRQRCRCVPGRAGPQAPGAPCRWEAIGVDTAEWTTLAASGRGRAVALARAQPAVRARQEPVPRTG